MSSYHWHLARQSLPYSFDEYSQQPSPPGQYYNIPDQVETAAHPDSNDNSSIHFDDSCSRYPDFDTSFSPRPSSEPRPNSNMLGCRNMNTADLVAAALGPSPIPRRQSSSQPTQSAEFARAQAAVPARSSPLTDLSDRHVSGETERSHTSPELKSGAQGRKRRRSKLLDEDDEYVDDDSRSSSPVRAREKRKSTRVSKNPKVEAEDGDEKSEPDLSQPVKSIRKQTPARAHTRVFRKKPSGIKVPQTLDEAGPADRMMWEWKNMGKNWEDIRNEWQRLVGVKPGQSSLSVRYIKLNENFAKHGAASDKDLLQFKKEAEEELKSQLWDKVSEKMLAFSPMSEHNPKDLKRRYDLIVRTGFDLGKVAQMDVSRAEKEEEVTEESTAVAGDASIEESQPVAGARHEIPVIPSSPFPEIIQDHELEQESATEDLPANQHLDEGLRNAPALNEYQSNSDIVADKERTPDFLITSDNGRDWQASRTTRDRYDGMNDSYAPTPGSAAITSSPMTIRIASSPFLRSLVTYGSDSD